MGSKISLSEKLALKRLFSKRSIFQSSLLDMQVEGLILKSQSQILINSF
jgi:hypothetical protein